MNILEKGSSRSGRDRYERISLSFSVNGEMSELGHVWTAPLQELSDVLQHWSGAVTSSNVSRALALLRAERPDAAALDVNLAGEWVTPVAEVLRAMFVPFILSSAYGAADLHAEPVLRDVVNIGKPSRPELLLKELRGVLGEP